MRSTALVAALLAFSVTAAAAKDLTWLEEQALDLGMVIIGGGIFVAWFSAGVWAAKSDRNGLAWIIGLSPIVILVLSFAGVFR
jgi:hypothetical protein